MTSPSSPWTIYAVKKAAERAAAATAETAVAGKAGLSLGAIRNKLGSLLAKVGGKGGLAAAGGAAGLTFLLSMLASYAQSKSESYKQTKAIRKALEDPFSLGMSMRENIAERETARAIENSRMRKMQREVATQDPKMYAYIHSLIAGDTIPHLGPGEARIGGSALIDADTLDRAAVHSDLWNDIRGPEPPPQMMDTDPWGD